MPKRDPEDGGSKTKVALGVTTVGGSVRVALELTNPNSSKDAVEAHKEKAQQPSVKEQISIWEKIKKWF